MTALEVALSSFTLTGQDPTVTAGGGGFTPADLFASSEAGGWYDPSDLSTLWQDTAGTTPVTADGQAVARIDDKSGNGNHLTQATAANRPLYKTAGGLHWLEFDGADDSLDGNNAVTYEATSIFAAVQPDTTTTNSCYIASTRPSTNGRFYFNSTLIAKGESTPTFTGTTNAQVLTGLWGASDAVMRRDGSTVATASSTLTGSATLPAIGAGALSTGNQTINTWFDGRIYGVIIRAATSTTTERDDTEAWLAAKSGVTL